MEWAIYISCTGGVHIAILPIFTIAIAICMIWKKYIREIFYNAVFSFFKKLMTFWENRKTVLYVDRYSVLKKNNKIFAFEMAIIISHLQMVIFCKLRKKALGPHLLENDNSISCRPQRWIDIWIMYSNNSTNIVYIQST